MTNRLVVAVAGIGFLVGCVQGFGAAETGAESLIAAARAVVTTPGPPSNAINKALSNSLDASLLILPESDHAGEYRSLVRAVKKALAGGAWLSAGTYQDLSRAYSLVSGGRTWQVPEELKASGREKGIEQAVKLCADFLDSALAEHRAGRDEAAVRNLVAFVLLVVTPIGA